MQAQASSELMNFSVVDWDRTRRADMEGVDRRATIGEVIGDAVRAIGLPLGTPFQALWKGRQLNQSETVSEIGIESDDEVQLVPEVRAG